MSIAVQNRNNSYLQIIESLPSKRQLIYQLIKENEPCTSFDISVKYQLPINEVVGRITELKNACLIIEHGSKHNSLSGKMNTTYRSVGNSERIDLINLKYQDLVDKKSKLEEDYHLGLSPYTKEVIKTRISSIMKKISNLEKLL